MKPPLKSRQNQRGMALLDVLFAIALLGLLITGFAKWNAINKERHEAGDYRVRIEAVIEALQRYQYQMHAMNVPLMEEFPLELNELMTEDEQFWINCSDNDEADKHCIQPGYVPWSAQRIDYSRGVKEATLNGQSQPISYAKMVFPLSSTAIAPNYRAKWATQLLKLPFAKEESNGDITVQVYDPLIAQLYDEFLQRNGNVPLTDDWDVGGEHTLTNVQDVTLANSDGSQKIVSKGLVNIYSAQHGDWIDKPACPPGQAPDLTLSLGQIYIGSDYELTGSQKPYAITETDTQWQVGLEVRVKYIPTGEYEKRNEGAITVLTQCR